MPIQPNMPPQKMPLSWIDDERLRIDRSARFVRIAASVDRCVFVLDNVGQVGVLSPDNDAMVIGFLLFSLFFFFFEKNKTSACAHALRPTHIENTHNPHIIAHAHTCIQKRYSCLSSGYSLLQETNNLTLNKPPLERNIAGCYLSHTIDTKRGFAAAPPIKWFFFGRFGCLRDGRNMSVVCR